MANQAPPEWRDKIVHATMTIGDTALSGVDNLPSQPQAMQGFHLLLSIETLAEAERVFATLAENGTVQMPFQATFWSPGFGVVVDQFGTPWEVNCEPPR